MGSLKLKCHNFLHPRSTFSLPWMIMSTLAESKCRSFSFLAQHMEEGYGENESNFLSFGQTHFPLKWYCCLPLLTILVTYKWWLEVQINIALNWTLEKDCIELGIKALSKQILALKFFLLFLHWNFCHIQTIHLEIGLFFCEFWNWQYKIIKSKILLPHHCMT
jgi:hypothetical protein